MQKLLLLLSLFLCNLFVNAQNFEIKVLNYLKLPIQNCNIYANSKLIGLTDNKGVFVLKNQITNYQTLKFYHVGYKSEIIEVRNLSSYNEIVLLDSIYKLKDFIVKSRAYKKLLVGNQSNKYNYMTFRVSSGGKIGSIISLPSNKFYLNELNFFIKDFYLPEQNKNVKVRVCNCYINNTTDTQEVEFIKPVYIALDKKNAWYNIKLDTNNGILINANCIFIDFEMMQKLTEKERLIKDRINYVILFGQTM